MTVFGLTGGLASGKSTVAAHFRTRGVTVIDADLLAREVVAPGTDGLREIVAAFGAEAIGPDGALQRKWLAARVFGDEAALAILNGITHPRIAALTGQRIAEAIGRGDKLVCYDAALLFENKVPIRPVVVVWAPHTLQVQRAVARDGCSPAEAEARIAAQMPLEEKRASADYVIENTGGLDVLQDQADRVLEAIRGSQEQGTPNATRGPI